MFILKHKKISLIINGKLEVQMFFLWLQYSDPVYNKDIHLSVRTRYVVFVYLSICLHLSVYLYAVFVNKSVCLSVCSVCLSICLLLRRLYGSANTCPNFGSTTYILDPLQGYRYMTMEIKLNHLSVMAI